MVQSSRWLTLSNLLTISRICMTPLVVYAIISHWWHYSFSLMMCAGLTDVLDGYIARWLHETTLVGTILDPIADKTLLTASFFTLAMVEFPGITLPWWFVYLMLAREAIILLGTALIIYIRPTSSFIAPTIWGKMTTFLQIVFILWLFACYFYGWFPQKLYSLVLGLLTVFSMLSLGSYIYLGVHYLKSASEK